MKIAEKITQFKKKNTTWIRVNQPNLQHMSCKDIEFNKKNLSHRLFFI
jgi:hypothetical protein